MESEPDSLSIKKFKDLLTIIAKLRDPEKGCPWDLSQTNKSLIPYLIEEAYEVADAIREKTDKDLVEELGDLLLQILLHAQIGSEKNRFCIEDVIESISQKLIRRHPHVFDDSVKKTIQEVQKDWENIKKSESQKQPSKTPFCDEIRRKSKSQSAINGALLISEKTAEKGLEWKSIQHLIEKLEEELNELKEALAAEDLKNTNEEIGDLLFTLINIARWNKINPEESLYSTNKKILYRLSYIEENINGDFQEYSIEELKRLWQKAKS